MTIDDHEDAMDLADKGDMARKAGDYAAARTYYAQACDIEARVAAASTRPHHRAVFHRSAAWLAVGAGQYERAIQLAEAGLAVDGVPEWERRALRVVIMHVKGALVAVGASE